MTQNKTGTLGDEIFANIENNEYLIALYEQLLEHYGHNTLGKESLRLGDKQLDDVLRFADLLSKSTHPERREYHQVWAQEIAVLCMELYCDNPISSPYLTSIFQAVGNYQALGRLENQALPDLFEQAFNEFQSDYLTVPGEEDKKFFAPQKRAFDAFKNDAFSFSAPTSLGKSFLMRTFIKDRMLKGGKENFAILVPTKALINEMRSRFINELGEELEAKNYRVVASGGDIVLEGEHNFIFVLTPERMLYLLINKPDTHLDYLFVDEAHKLSGKSKRAPFYYQVTTMLLQRPEPPRFIFASPNIPNPGAFLSLLQSAPESSDAMRTRFSPVSQFKFFVDLQTQTVSGYNHRTKQTQHLSTLNGISSVEDYLLHLRQLSLEKKREQTIVYHGSKQKAVENARHFASLLPKIHDDDLQTLAADIRREVHDSYFLAELIEKGVAYHVGHLPASVRLRVEELFREGKIHTIFCTSTLLEGVNLPADNLVVTSHKNGRSNLNEIDFNNLIGRVGRIEFNLFGNIYFVMGEGFSAKSTVEKLLKTDVPNQQLAVSEASLPNKIKEAIVCALKEGRMPEPTDLGKGEQAEMARTFSIILLRDLTAGRESLVTRSFQELLTPDTRARILEKFRDSYQSQQDDDINVSVDQHESLEAAVKAGLRFPHIDRDTGRPNYDDTLGFLQRLARIFKWDKYESATIGRTNNSGFTSLRWYAVILIQWIEGNGLNRILKESIDYQRKNPDKFWVNYRQVRYLDTPLHKNIVCNDTLEAIENIILFSFANYFLRVSNEIKKQEGKEVIENDWYEYVEYGTTNTSTITLQRMGFTRESATWIRKHHAGNYMFQDKETGSTYLNPALLDAENLSVRREANEIKFNVPKSFGMPYFLW
ncbi:DEAD/DEAH box helicase [Corynebacterium epidermidicanis]|uniref:Helicase family protein n=1 Tax=Corynebacterium epidermidicanis TaxID=1050174 RepID=A0A0G3GTX4_9CORY|nr:DEAD/DEAH box helicase [Corynebacterium epidermidicanis]AKK03003.1 helicase family protein [Corynebacterium epidermidicanis]